MLKPHADSLLEFAGIVNFGVQAMLFIFLLYALLAAETDPLTYTIRVLVCKPLLLRPAIGVTLLVSVNFRHLDLQSER